MKVAHVLLVHKNPNQILRFLRTLAHAEVDCWLHIDKKFDTPAFRKTFETIKVNYVQPSIRVDWGCYNTVEAMLNSLRNVVATGKYDYVNFLSGQDYIIKPPVEFIKYLQENKGKQFIGIQPYDVSLQNIIRIRKYHLNGYTFAGKKIVERVVNKILPDRRIPLDFDIRKGSQWFTITTEAAQYILKFVENNPDYVRFFKLVDTADEFFFQTILFNSEYRAKIRDGVFHYTDWSEHKKHPKLLTMEDLQRLTDSYYFFARKFDIEADVNILDALDIAVKTGMQ